MSATALDHTTPARSTPFAVAADRTIFIHDVLLSGLMPATRYYYKCGSVSGGFSDVHSFVTFTAGAHSVSGMPGHHTYYLYSVCSDENPKFAVYGDAGVKNFRTLDRLTGEAANNAFDAILYVGGKECRALLLPRIKQTDPSFRKILDTI